MLLGGIALLLLQHAFKFVLIQHWDSKTVRWLVEPWCVSTLSTSMVTDHRLVLVYLHQGLVLRPTGIIIVAEAVAPTTAAVSLTDWVATTGTTCVWLFVSLCLLMRWRTMQLCMLARCYKCTRSCSCSRWMIFDAQFLGVDHVKWIRRVNVTKYPLIGHWSV
jgi:hypothetical protein